MPSDAVDTYVDGELVKAYGPTMDEVTGISKTNYPTGGNLLIIPTAVDKLDSMGLKLNPLNRKHTFYSKQSSDTAAFHTILYPYQGNTDVYKRQTPDGAMHAKALYGIKV